MINDRCVILFLKAFEKGRVKTRLATFLGEETALKLYHCFAEDTLGMIIQGGYPLLIFHDPPTARRQIGQWLGKGNPFTKAPPFLCPSGIFPLAAKKFLGLYRQWRKATSKTLS